MVGFGVLAMDDERRLLWCRESAATPDGAHNGCCLRAVDVVDRCVRIEQC